MNDSTTAGAVRGLAMARAAEAMLRALGGTEIRVLLAASGSADANARQLGLESPALEAVTVSPVVVRRIGDTQRLQFLISTSAVEGEAAIRQMAPQALLAAATAIELGSTRLKVENVMTEQFGGAAYLYRVVTVEV